PPVRYVFDATRRGEHPLLVCFSALCVSAFGAADPNDEPPGPRGLRLLFGGGRERGCGIRADDLRDVEAGPEVGRSLAVGDAVAHRIEPVLDVERDVPEILIGHVPEGWSRHRRGEVLGVARKVALTRGRG